VFAIVKQLVDHYDAKIEALEKQINKNRTVDMINTIDSRSQCVMPVAAHEKRIKNSQKSLKQATTLSSVQSKKSQVQPSGHGTMEKTSPLLNGIEQSLGLTD
jgi:hypothetical protein